MKLVTPIIVALALACSYSPAYSDSKSKSNHVKANKASSLTIKKGKKDKTKPKVCINCCVGNTSTPVSTGGACATSNDRKDLKTR